MCKKYFKNKPLVFRVFGRAATIFPPSLSVLKSGVLVAVATTGAAFFGFSSLAFSLDFAAAAAVAAAAALALLTVAGCFEVADEVTAFFFAGFSSSFSSELKNPEKILQSI